LSATPIGNELRDIFSQALFIDNGKTFGKSLWNFNLTYYLKAPDCPQWFLKRTSKHVIQEKIKQIAYGYLQEDILKLPEKRYVCKTAEMSPGQKRRYMTLINDWEYELDGKTIELNHVIVRLAKLRQVASGFLYGPNNTVEYFDCDKLRLLKDILTDTTLELVGKKKIVIWCAFTAEIEMIAHFLRIRNFGYMTYHGKKSDKDKIKARKAFENSSQIKYFVGQVDSGVGMNELMVADTAIYYSNSHKVISRVQSEGRIRRYTANKKQKHKSVTYWDLMTEDSTDISIYKSLKEKIDLAEFVLQKIRQGVKLSTILN
jgi:SNF2 family DNA or RNA helicase